MNEVAVAAWAESLDEQCFALADVPLPGSWSERGSCRAVPPWVFFPARGDSLDAAKGVCARCVVRQECASYAIPHVDLKGVWGGLSEAERRRLRAGRGAEDVAAGPRCTQSPRGSLYRTLVELGAHPGRWGRVVRYASPESAGAMASLLRRGKRPTPPGEWEFVAGGPNDAGGSDLYACLVEVPAQIGQAS
ncbi:hypothetical protein BH20ACT3_BH20ACT3_12200 [soil metagenome]